MGAEQRLDGVDLQDLADDVEALREMASYLADAERARKKIARLEKKLGEIQAQLRASYGLAGQMSEGQVHCRERFVGALVHFLSDEGARSVLDRCEWGDYATVDELLAEWSRGREHSSEVQRLNVDLKALRAKEEA